MGIDCPRPTPGDLVVHIPLADYLALREEIAQLFSLTSSMLYLTSAQAAHMAELRVVLNVRARAWRLWERMAEVPAATVMPGDDKPP